MTIRTIRKTITFLRPFYLKGVDRLLPPRDYNVVTDEELLEGLSFSAYRRVSTTVFVPAPSGSAIEMVTIDPQDLQAAQDQDAMPNEPTAARLICNLWKEEPYAQTRQFWRTAQAIPHL
jgi:hypothetical protein